GDDAVGDGVEVARGNAQDAALGVAVLRAARADLVGFAVLVHAGDAGGAAGDGNHGGIGAAFDLEIAGGAQAGKHGAADAPGLGAQARLAGGVGCAVGVELGGDAALLPLAHVGSDLAGKAGALGGADGGEQALQVGRQVHQVTSSALPSGWR